MFQITIDGPSGVGKSTLAKALSKETNFLYINTGLIFRGLAWYLLNKKCENINEALTDIAKHKNFVFEKNKWFLNNKEISEEQLRNKEVTAYASSIATNSELRNFVLAIEQKIALNENVIMEGRDIGTAVFPNAILKIFLNASPEIKAKRRYEELKEKNLLNNRSFEEVFEEMKARDKKDEERALCPLKKADDAISLISDNYTVEELVSKVKELLEIKLKELKAFEKNPQKSA